MKEIGAYLAMRRRLAWRLLLEVGWLRLAVLAPVVIAALGRVLVVAARHPLGQWALPVGFAWLVASAHRQRADLGFLAVSAPRFRRWLAGEYGLWAVPLAVALGLFHDWGAAALSLALAPWAALLPPAREVLGSRKRPRSLFRSEAFEWVSGMRLGGGYVWLGLLAVAVWQHDSPLGPVVALVGWLLVVLGCYGVPEPATMLVLAARTPGAFLRRRLLLGLGYAALTAAPFGWLLAAGPVGVGGALGVGAVWLGLLALLILTKYAFYPNAVHIRITQALLLSSAVTMLGHPVYPVLLLVAVGGLIWQSRRRLASIVGS